MFTRKTSAFSPFGEYFACCDVTGILRIWETSSNTLKKEYNINSHLKQTCSLLTWGMFENTIIGNIDGSNKECELLVIGTTGGGIYMYDFRTGKLCNHFVSCHTGPVNDFSLDSGSNRLFSCSSDMSVIIWDIISGKVKQKWNADEELHSVCLVDSNNLLTGGISILWWNIKEQNVIWKFNCHGTPTTLLSVVRSEDLSSCSYFLSSAAGEPKISAWCLNKENSKNVVASFTLPEELLNVDVSDCFSKNNPMILSAVTKSGAMVLFQHVLNGKRKNLSPQMTLHIMPNVSGTAHQSFCIPIISSKIFSCAESCVIAYGCDGNLAFESVNMFDCPKKLTLTRDIPSKQQNIFDSVSEVNLCNKLNEFIVANGITSPTNSPYSSHRRKKHQKTDKEISQKEKTIDTSNRISTNDRISPKSTPNVKKKQKLSKIKVEKLSSSESDSEDFTAPTDPSEMVDILVRGLQEERTSLINSILRCDNYELIKSTVANLPLHSLNLILLELHRRLILQERRYNSTLRKWLKEILAIHLPYLITCKDHTDILNRLKEYVDSRKAGETLIKMNMLRGLLNVQKQTVTRERHDSSRESDTEKLMES